MLILLPFNKVFCVYCSGFSSTFLYELQLNRKSFKRLTTSFAPPYNSKALLKWTRWNRDDGKKTPKANGGGIHPSGFRPAVQGMCQETTYSNDNTFIPYCFRHMNHRQGGKRFKIHSIKIISFYFLYQKTQS